MPGGSSDLLEIVVLPTSPDAFLRRGSPLEGELLHAQEGALELDHTRVREEQGRIVIRHEGRTRLDRVASRTEKFEETGPDFSCGHDACPWASIGAHYNDSTGPAQHETDAMAASDLAYLYEKARPTRPGFLTIHGGRTAFLPSEVYRPPRSPSSIGLVKRHR
jgi:hypothetical protein